MSDNININQETQKEGYDALVAVSAKYGIDFVTILDDDIYTAMKILKENGVENADTFLAKLNPQICKTIRDEFNERICEYWSDCLEEAINSQIDSGEEGAGETEESPEGDKNDA
jgi:hypothetical protein